MIAGNKLMQCSQCWREIEPVHKYYPVYANCMGFGILWWIFVQ